MPRVGFKSTIPAFERAKTCHAHGREVTGVVFSLFNDAVSTSDCIVSNWATANNQLDRIRTEAAVTKFKESLRNPTKISVTIVDVPIGHLTNVSVKRCGPSHLLGTTSMVYVHDL
jgi:hypothetical protein